MRLGAIIAVALVLGLLIVGGVGIQSYLEIQRVADTNRWVSHTHQVLEELERVLLLLQDAETGQRGFILTGEDRYLEPYNAATTQILKEIDAVVVLTKDNPPQQQGLQQLRQLSRGKLAELQETVKLRRESGLEAALPVIRSDRGKRIMDDIRALVGQMETRERVLLEAQNRDAEQTARKSVLTLGLGVLLSLVVLAAAAVIAIRTMKLADRDTVSHGAGRNWPKIAIRYAFAVAVVALAMAARAGLERAFGPMPPFIIFFPGVLLVATVAGGGPGILATLLSVLAADYWYFPPVGQFSISAPNEAFALGIFGGSSLLLSILAERMHRARWAEAVSVTQEKELALLDLGNVMALDLGHRVVRWSEGNRRLYGFDAQEAQGRFAQELLQTQFPRPRPEIHRELLAKGHWEGEVVQRRRDGTQVTVALMWALRRDERGRPLAILEVSTDITPQKAAEESLRQQSEELAQQNEELTRQSEELAQQSEELSEQNEELQTQSEEIQALNVELGHREKVLQTLVDSARLPIGEREVMGEVCRAAMEMIGQPAAGAAACERCGEELRIIAQAGFDGADVPASWAARGSFVEVVIQQDRTASLEDASLRPDLALLPVAGQARFAAVLSSPLHVGGKPIGAVSIFSHTPRQWTAEQFRLIEWLAAKCSNALEAMRLAAEVATLSQQRQIALDAARLGWWHYNPVTGISDWDDRYKEIFGVAESQRPNEEVLKRLHPDDLPGVRAAVQAALGPDDPRPYGVEYRINRPDGSVRWVEAHGAAVFEGQGSARRAVSFVGTVADITERKLAEQALHESRERLDLALTSARMATFDWDILTNKRTWSDGVHRLLGTSPETFTGKPEEFFNVVHPEDRPAVQAALAKAVETAAPYETEYRAVWPDGSIHHMAARGMVHRDDAGRAIRMTGICWDISDRKRAEEAVLRTVEELERSNQELEQFAYISSHDLQEPLRQVRAYVQLLRDRHADRLDGKAIQYMQFVYDGAERMSNLVQGLLEYSRVGATDAHRQTVPCQQALDAALANLQVSIAESHARVTHDELPALVAEPTQLTQLFQNLVGNAIKFRADGVPPQVHVGCRRQGHEWLLRVTDNGIGIAPEFHEKVFMIFQRLHTRDKYPGTGIGLAICKKIVEQHGGRIWIESAAGEGSTFCFTLPDPNSV